VRRLQQLRPRLRTFGIFFHELFAKEPPWRSAFWLGPMQRRIAADLVGLCDFWLTNHTQAAQWLERHALAVPHGVLPVYSNVGEPDDISGGRLRKIVVFGGPSSRVTAYRHLGESFWRWAREAGFEVHDIGPPIADEAFVNARGAAGLKVHGPLPAEEVSRHLREAAYGLVRYPTHVAAKSGVFAAYCAHGVCPVLLAHDYDGHDGLQAGVHYLAGVDALRAGRADAAAVGAAAHAWYQPHRVQAHADTFKRMLSAPARARQGVPS
jgi:hypothetical protein